MLEEIPNFPQMFMDRHMSWHTMTPPDGRKWGRLIYKSVSGTRSIVAELSDVHRGRLDDVSTCPTQFQ